MEEILDQAMKMLGFLLALITLRISLDLILTLWRDKKIGSSSLVAIFISLVMVGTSSIAATYIMDVPIWMKVWMSITLILASVGSYMLLQEMK